MTTFRIVPESDDCFGSHNQRFEAAVRQRAFEIYCHHDQQGCPAAIDWQAAKRELELAPLAGVDETDQEVRISACVVDEDHCRDSVITLRVMPHHIIAECGKRLSILDLPCAIRTDAVRARLDGDQLSLVAARTPGQTPQSIKRSAQGTALRE
jgi:hypothetical protein